MALAEFESGTTITSMREFSVTRARSAASTGTLTCTVGVFVLGDTEPCVSSSPARMSRLTTWPVGSAESAET